MIMIKRSRSVIRARVADDTLIRDRMTHDQRCSAIDRACGVDMACTSALST